MEGHACSLAERLRQLYRAAMRSRYVQKDGSQQAKFVNLDMEEYRDLHLTAELFQQVLAEPEFFHHEAGIVLQSYLPDSFAMQQELTRWAMERHAKGGASIKIRIVKGANLAMEQWESALHLWPQAPFPHKESVDANFKRMIAYGCQKEHARAAHLGIGSHNLFDIAYALLLRAEKELEKEISFEMLEGMADHLRRVVQQVAGGMLLYCRAATREEFQNAVAYLMRRLDENTAPENFLRQMFDLKPGTPAWDQQANLFSEACLAAAEPQTNPRRTQNRQKEIYLQNLQTALTMNLTPIGHCLKTVSGQKKSWLLTKVPDSIPLVIGGEEFPAQKAYGNGQDPSCPDKTLYHYALATEGQADVAIACAKKMEKSWGQTPVELRTRLLASIANELRRHRAD